MGAVASNSAVARLCFYLLKKCCVSALVENQFSVQLKSPWAIGSWCIMAHMVSTVENHKWLPGVCSFQELISTSLQLMGSNEQLSLEWGVEHDSGTAQHWELTWKCPLVVSKGLRNQNEVSRVWWVQKGNISNAKRTELPVALKRIRIIKMWKDY